VIDAPVRCICGRNSWATTLIYCENGKIGIMSPEISRKREQKMVGGKISSVLFCWLSADAKDFER
jgi:hypothetical protein